MNKTFMRLLPCFLAFMLASSYSLQAQSDERLEGMAAGKLENWKNPLTEWNHIAVPKIDSLKLEKSNGKLILWFAPELSYYPFREESCRLFRKSLVDALGRKFRKYDIELITNTYRIEQLVPNYFRKDFPADSSCFPVPDTDKRILVKKISDDPPLSGLHGKSIALWNSHGYYFEMSLDRWEFQRAKLFGTVEDVSITGYVLPYLSRMLEKAGATVHIPRERDIQTSEVIVDNDRSTANSAFMLSTGKNSELINKGFILTDTIFAGFNPFRNGSSLRTADDTAHYIPDIPSRGDYAVYISYPLLPDNTGEALYTVHHTGGSTGFLVDQTMGGETWIYLGTFNFD